MMMDRERKFRDQDEALCVEARVLRVRSSIPCFNTPDSNGATSSLPMSASPFSYRGKSTVFYRQWLES